MAKYKLFAGLGGGFGGGKYVCTEEFENQEAAELAAYQLAWEEYESYEGLHGLADRDAIIENYEDYGLDEDFTEEDVEEVYRDEVEGWIDCWAELVEE